MMTSETETNIFSVEKEKIHFMHHFLPLVLSVVDLDLLSSTYHTNDDDEDKQSSSTPIKFCEKEETC